MESEDEQETETTQMTQAPVGNVDSTNFQQVCCLCLAFLFVLLVISIITSIIVVFAVKSWTFPSEHCPSGWIGYKKKCYFISEEEKNWTSSQTFCAKNESLLAVFENQEEMDSLAKLLRIDDSWIGLRKKGESFYWESGIALKADMFQIRNHSECAYLDAFTISTSACSLPRHWICIR